MVIARKLCAALLLVSALALAGCPEGARESGSSSQSGGSRSGGGGE
jgi:hypothetical protein